MTELAAPQISSLMEALPGIAAVLRSPVANAMVAVSRAAAGLEEFQLSHGEELLRFGVRRNLLTQEEVDKVIGELREVAAGRPQKPAPPPPERPKKVVVAVPQTVKPLEIRPTQPPLKAKPAPAPVKATARPLPAPPPAAKRPAAKPEPPKIKAAPKKAVATVKQPKKALKPPTPKRLVAAPKASKKPAAKRH